MRTQGTVTIIAAGLVLLTGFVVYRDLQRSREVDTAHEQVLSSGAEDLEDVPTDESPYLEDHPLPGNPELAFLEDPSDGTNDLALLSEISSAPLPNELPPTDKIDPVPLLSPERREQNTAIIKEVMPDLTDEQLEFWLKETRDLPSNMIRDLLKLRSQIGSVTDSFSPQAISSPSADLIQTDQVDPTFHSLQQAKSLILQNLMNEKSVGYLEQLLVFTFDESGGVRLASSTLNSALKFERPTGRALDIALVHPHAFLIVQSGNREYLTRYGRLIVGESGQLQLDIEGTDILATNELKIPEHSAAFSIKPDGRIISNTTEKETPEDRQVGRLRIKMVLHPEHLKPVGNGLYALTPPCGNLLSPDSDDLLESHALNASNVNWQQNNEQLTSLNRWLEQRQQQRKSQPRLP